RFATDADTTLRVDTLVSSPGSVLEVGTPDQPVDAAVTATIEVADTGPIDVARDPSQLGRGLVLHGTVRMHGADRTDWTALAEAPRSGDDRLVLPDAPTGWQVGDRLVVAGVQPDGTGEEQVSVAAVEGSTAVLDGALSEDHVPPRADLDVHVANLTRNVVVASASKELDRRGHVMFMHNRDVDVANAAFVDLGRTDKTVPLADVVADAATGAICGVDGPVTNPRARYSVHFHRNGVVDDGDRSTVTGSVVEGNPGWGYVNHSSSVDFVDNVAFDVAGAAYNTEAGDETGSFVRNLSVRTHGPGSIPARAEQPTERRETQDFGFAGHGFWLQGPAVDLEGNVAAGATGAGIMVYSEGLIESGVGRAAFGDEAGGEPFPVVQQPLARFTDNS
ncbi:MAG: G8 domain-containing protein, partial [Actinomycetota bacterium]